MPIELELDQAINAESGRPLMLNGVVTGFYVIPMLDGSTALNGEIIDHSGPYAMAIMADIETLDISAGDAGDVITMGGANYTLLAIDPDGHGGALLRLEEQP